MGITALIGSSVLSAGAAVSSANKQASAAKGIAKNQLAAGQDAATKLQPYADEGKVGMNYLNQNMGYLSTPYAPTMEQLQATPGYQFTLNQGLQATQNSAAARGLGLSGAAVKGAADYATGLADSTYAKQAAIYQQNQSQIGNFLTGVVGAGQNAAAGQGALITGQTNAAAGTQMAGAQAAASGISGAASQLNTGMSNLYQNGLINQMLAQNGSGQNSAAIAKMSGGMFGFGRGA